MKQLESEVHEWEKQHAKAAEAELQKTCGAREFAGRNNAKAQIMSAEISEADGNLLRQWRIF